MSHERFPLARRHGPSPRATALIALVFAGCAPTAPSASSCPASPYLDPGPFGVGVETITDAAGNEIEVFYPIAPAARAGAALDVYDIREWLPDDARMRVPADAPTTFEMDAVRDAAPSDAGPFPLVLFSHGLGGYRLQSSFLMTHLSSWGFVVAAPEHPERNLTRVLSGMTLGDESVAQLVAAFAALESDARVDADRVALMGHSMGGGAVAVIADDGSIPIDAFVSLATVTYPTVTTLPGLLMGGTNDALATPEMMRSGFDGLATRPKRLVTIAGAGHLAFSDICAIGREAGGVLQIAMDAGITLDPLVVTLATDGCRATDLPAEEGWPVVRAYVAAHLALALDVESAPAGASGLEPASRACFGASVAVLETVE